MLGLSLQVDTCKVSPAPVCSPWERDPDPYEGRAAIHHPVPQCCSGQSCLKQDSGRHAVMTTVRSQYYMMGFRELHCSLEHSNPGLQLIVLGVEGDLPPKDVEVRRD